MPGPVFSESESVALHTIEEDDLDFLRRWRNDPAVRRPLTVNEPSNGEQTEQFFENAISTDEGANFLICVADRKEATENASDEAASSGDADPVGMISLFDEDRTAGTATIAYWVIPPEHGNGYATDATDLVCEHAFVDRRLHKVRADVLASNVGSQRVLEKTGFEREGVLRDEKFVDGGHVDVYRYGVLADDWRAE